MQSLLFRINKTHNEEYKSKIAVKRRAALEKSPEYNGTIPSTKMTPMKLKYSQQRK